MSEALIVHPRGYSRVVDSRGCANLPSYNAGLKLRAQRIDEDTTTETLIRKHLGQAMDTDWAVQRVEIAECARLYGCFQNWVYFQLARNGYIFDLTLDFLLDTLTFIATGVRRMEVQTWKGMIESNLMPRPEVASDARLIAAQSILSGINWNDFMAQWINQPNGYDDMVFSTYLFFGKL